MTDTSPQNASAATQDPPKLDELRQTASKKHKEQWHSVKLELQTITPVYGGGTTAGEPDLLLPFRPRAVKNSLRHWWWLLNRHKPEYKGKSDLLYRDMTAIWGGASDKDGKSQRAKVRVHVDALPLVSSNKIQSKDYEKSLGYVLWMTLQAELADKGAALIKPGYKCTIQIDVAKSLEDQLPQLTSVVNAWLHLGGLGARTTRGLGKVQINKVHSPSGIEIKRFFNKEDEWLVNTKNAFTTLTRNKKPHSDALKALEFSVDAFKTFRQARQHGQIPSGKTMRINRSYWPKADVIRANTKKYPDYHAPHPGIKSSQMPTPELLFGAPIVYKFKDKRDPDAGLLTFAHQKETLERFTSPLLLTVVRTAEEEFLPAAFIFPYWSDVRDKQVLIEPNKYIEPGIWWPDISQENQKPLAKKLLSGDVMHTAKLFNDAEDDPLRNAVKNSATDSGNPLAAFLKFFSTWDPSIK